MRGQSHITAAFRWLAPALGASACALLLIHATASCVSRPLETAEAAAAQVAGHAGPPLESTIVKQQDWFANTRPPSHGSTDVGGSTHYTFPTPQSEPALTGVWLPLQSADVLRHRGRSPPSILPIS